MTQTNLGTVQRALDGLLCVDCSIFHGIRLLYLRHHVDVGVKIIQEQDFTNPFENNLICSVMIEFGNLTPVH